MAPAPAPAARGWPRALLGRVLPARPYGRSAAGGGPARAAGLYELLGVSASATQAQIKAAYYEQSFRCHPDRNAGSEEAAARFTALHQAYAVLGSAALRRKYDRGALSREELSSAGRPSARAPGQRSAAARRPPGAPVFDFDAFYRAHYGEQLERQQLLRERRQQRKRQQEEAARRWQGERLMEFSVSVFLFSALVLLFGMR
ncbi:dnaJ homolog subfamily C member 30, mitochondrial [Trachemys scripta elegans]|uniref:dnaJ homolog subfamily C member 30, mitochondrial n=1 Tax=Trachemys scripta elegans TaxID=31138 RepID=UPI001551FCE7|nr:dnaJ homolog subfamily C member 30, mitochondrial [Trachemys scripta elegans]